MDQYNDPHATSSAPPEGVVLDTHQIIHHDGENLNNLGDELLNSSDLISPNSDSTVLEQQNRSSAGSTLRDSSTARLGRPSRRRRTDSEMKGTDSDIVKKDPAKGHVGGDNRAPSAMENLLSSNTRKTPWDAAAFEKTSHRRERGSRYSVVVEGFPQGKDTTPIQKPDRVGAIEVLPSTGPPLRSTTVRETEDSTDSSCTGQELIAAIAIGEEDEESQEKALAHTVEYDLESKPRIYQDPRFRWYCTMGTVLFVLSLVVCSVAIVIHKKNNHVTVLESLVPTTAPTSSPTSVRDMEYRNYLAQSVNDKVFNPETPHYTAVEWIVNKDPMQMELTDPKLLQRFLMALLYFQSTDNGSKEWKSCNPPKEGEDDTCVFMTLTHLANNTEIYVPVGNYTRWLSGEDECSWAGLYCDGSQVVAINIDGQNMTGPLPSELVLLPGLQSLSFSNNQITGSIPIECATFRNLLNLELNGNHLTGTIPTEFFEQGSLPLENFNLGDNDLNRTLDTRIGSVMTNLKGLHIFGNHFHGQFPSEAGNLRYLSFFRVYENDFSGPIPTELGNLGQLSEFWFHDNRFSGTIPSEVGRLSRLGTLRLHRNHLTGRIPEELFNLTTLQYLEINDMALTGTLSTRVGQLTALNALMVHTNQLTGTIPTEIQRISSSLLNARFHFNQFTGQVPTELCSLGPPHGFQSLYADCLPVDNPTNPCLCCTACCDRDQELCLSNFA